MFKIISKLFLPLFSIGLFILLIGSSIGVGVSAETFNGSTGGPGNPNTLPAQTADNQRCQGVSNDICFLQPSNVDCLFQNEKNTCKLALFDSILNFLKQVAPYVATLIVVFAGFEYFSDKNIKETSALGTLQAAIVGLIIILIGPVLVTVIVDSFSKKGFDAGALQRLLSQLVDFLINISTFAAVLIIVIGGYVYFTEGFSGDGKSSKGRNLISNGVIGLVVMLFARPVVTLLKDTFDTKTAYTTVSNGVIFKSTIDYRANPIVDFITTLLSTFLIPISAVATVIFIVFGGYYWITSNGDEKRSKIALDLVRNAVIGLIVVLLSTTIVQLILYFIKPTEFINRPTTSVTAPNTNANTNFPANGANTPAPARP